MKNDENKEKLLISVIALWTMVIVHEANICPFFAEK